MTDPATPIIALALDPAVLEPAAPAGVGVTPGWLDPAPWLELTLAAERVGVSLVTLADSHRAEDGVPRLDAIMLAAFLGARSTRVGVIAEADTTVSEPYLLATQIATVDFTSRGRAGWLAQVTGAPEDAGYVGPREVATGTDAWAEAAEYVEVVRQLWDSWEDGAEIRDISTQRFIDRARVHHINFAGEHLRVAGPSISPRPPQGQPPVAVAVAGGPGNRVALALAVSQADVIFLGSGFDAPTVRAAAAEHGRELRLLADLPIRAVTPSVVTEALAGGFDGVRLIPATLPGEIEWVARLAQELGLDPSRNSDDNSGGGGGATLRDTLGLPRPANRYSTESAPSGASA